MRATEIPVSLCLLATLCLSTSCDSRQQPPAKRPSAVENDPLVKLVRTPSAEATEPDWDARDQAAYRKTQETGERSPESPPPSAPFNDPEDRSVRQVKAYLSETLKDPGSIRYLDWSPVMKTDRGFQVVCTYRARAGSFGVVTEKKVFHMTHSGQVVTASPVRQNLKK